MPRPSRAVERRRELTPKLALAFAQLGYRGATTAELARRCKVQEPALYRLWPDKQAMFAAAIEHVYDNSVETWKRLLAEPGRGTAAERVLAYEAEHHGELGLYRLLFSALGETDDPAIAEALRHTYGRFVEFLSQQIAAHRGGRASQADSATAWAFIGLGTAANLGHELSLLNLEQRGSLFREIGAALLGAARAR
ncbi:MAG: TetR/AcrR family transcriptional regulator [Phycisphaerae bacterium]